MATGYRDTWFNTLIGSTRILADKPFQEDTRKRSVVDILVECGFLFMVIGLTSSTSHLSLVRFLQAWLALPSSAPSHAAVTGVKYSVAKCTSFASHIQTREVRQCIVLRFFLSPNSNGFSSALKRVYVRNHLSSKQFRSLWSSSVDAPCSPVSRAISAWKDTDTHVESCFFVMSDGHSSLEFVACVVIALLLSCVVKSSVVAFSTLR